MNKKETAYRKLQKRIHEINYPDGIPCKNCYPLDAIRIFVRRTCLSCKGNGKLYKTVDLSFQDILKAIRKQMSDDEDLSFSTCVNLDGKERWWLQLNYDGGGRGGCEIDMDKPMSAQKQDVHNKLLTLLK